MMQIKSVVITALLVFVALTSVVYTSCSKLECSKVVCENGGNCYRGNCKCPTGFSGDRCQFSTIEYKNNTFTLIAITVNGSKAVIPVGGSVSFPGTINDTARATASTSGTTSSGKKLGAEITWAINTPFSENGLTTVPLNVDPPYFYLEIINEPQMPADFTDVIVNYGTPEATIDFVNIPPSGALLPIGYYKAYPNMVIYAQGPVWYCTWSGFTVPVTENAAITVTSF